MKVQKRSMIDGDGALTHVLEENGDVDYDTIEIRHDPQDDDLMQVVGYQDDEAVYQQSFEMRDLSFDPITPIGRGESDRLAGTSPMDNPENDEDVPKEIQVAFNSIGMAVVPPGEEWLDE